MAQADVELVMAMYAVAGIDEEFELAGMIADPAWLQRVGEHVDPDLKIKFVPPDATGVRVMEQSEFEGLEGLQEGWRIWMQPWEQFRIHTDELIDAGDGQVLMLGRATAVMKGSGIEIPQETAALHRIQDRKIVSISFYLDQAQARRDAGA